MSEAELQQLVLDVASAYGVLAYHTHDSRRSQPGFPDLVLVGSTGVLYVELKSTKGRLSPMQIYWLNALHEAGQRAQVWRPADWPTTIVDELKALGRLAATPPAPSQAEVRRKLAARRTK